MEMLKASMVGGNSASVCFRYGIMALPCIVILNRLKNAKQFYFSATSLSFLNLFSNSKLSPIPGLPFRQVHDLQRDNLKRHFAIQDIREYFSKLTAETNISWPTVNDELRKCCRLDAKNRHKITSIVFRSCEKDLAHIGVSYYKYLLETGYKFSLTEYSFFIIMLGSLSQDEISQYEDIILDLFEKIKPYLDSMTLIKNDCVKVFSCTQKTWEEMYHYRKKLDATVWSWIGARAFAAGDPQTGWSLLNEEVLCFQTELVQSYFDYCLRLAKSRKFSVSLLNDIVNYCAEYGVLIPDLNLLQSIRNLVFELNNDPDRSYDWFVDKCEPDKHVQCNVCRTKLKNVSISKDEFDVLKSHFLKDAMIRQNINIKTSDTEVKRFFLFLSSTRPYNFVIDGLNLAYANTKRNLEYSCVNYLKEKGKDILLIGKSHLKKLGSYSFLVKNCQIFLTQNTSDDDLFVLYAALHGGKGTGFLSRDFYRSYYFLLDDQVMKRIFLKWQISHQYFLNKYYKIVPPARHSYLSQSTQNSTNLTWHLCIHSKQRPIIHSLQDCEWICLRARKR